MASFWGEIRRRKVFQVAVAYAIVGWLLAQVAATTFPILLLPDWILRAFVIFLLLGFPLAIVLAWAFETTPEGVIRDRGAFRRLGLRLYEAPVGLICTAPREAGVAWK